MGALTGLAETKSSQVFILTTSRSDESVLPRSQVVNITATRSDIEQFVEDAITQGISRSSQLSGKILVLGKW